MTTTTEPATLSDRVRHTLWLDNEADRLHDAQTRHEEDHGDRPSGWADVDAAHITAGDEALALLHDLRPVLAAIEAFAAMGDMPCDVATHLTCDEVDALALILARAGHVEAAAGWVSDHAQPSESDEGDVDEDPRTLHHHVFAAYDATDDDCEGREAADAAALEYVRAQLLPATPVGWRAYPCGNVDCDEAACPMPPEGATVYVTVAQDARRLGSDEPDVPVERGTAAVVDTCDPEAHQVIADLPDGTRVWLAVDDLANAAPA